jgi:RNase P subunit RPR2
MNRPSARPDKAVGNTPGTLERVTELLTSHSLPDLLKGRIETESNGQTLYYEQAGIENDIDYLQLLCDFLCDLVEASPNPAVVALGGEIAPLLQTIVAQENHPLREIAVELLYSIEQETRMRLGQQAHRLFCPRCIVRCGVHDIPLSALTSAQFYGCRTCGQSRQFFEFEGRVIAVLDRQMAAGQLRVDNVLRVNWLTQQALFDFDEVEIVTATDEEVERFAVQVGNDTDAARRSRYQQMPCLVSPEAKLSENSVRVLQRMFHQVILTGR